MNYKNQKFPLISKNAVFHILLLLFLLSVGTNGFAAIKTLNPNADAYVMAITPNSNYGSDMSITIGGYDLGIFAYVKFNLSPIPSGSIINDAKLRLYCTTILDNGPVGIQLAASGWTEGGITWNNAPGGEHPLVTSTPPSSYQWWEIPVTSIVKKWIEVGASNRGFRLGKLGSGFVQFLSREFPNNNPELVISYTPGFYNASGKVTSTSNGQGVFFIKFVFSRVSGSGAVPTSVISNVKGEWSQSGFEPGTTYRVTPTNQAGQPSYTFQPAYKDFSSSAGSNVSGLDFVTGTSYSVTIRSDPAGAEVRLGSVEAPPTCTTPCTLTGLEGNQIVYLTKDGYEDLEFILTPNDDGTTKNFPLTARITLNFTAPFSGASADHIEYEGPHFWIRVLGAAPSDTDPESGDIHHASALNLYAAGSTTWQVDDTVQWDFNVPRSGWYKISVNGHIVGSIASAGVGVVYDCKHLLVVGASIVGEGSVYSRLHDTLGEDVTSGIWEISTFGAGLVYNVLFPEGGGWISYVMAAYDVYKIINKIHEILTPVKSFNYDPILGNDWYFYADLEANEDYQFEFFVRSAAVGGVSAAVMYSFTDVIVSFTDVTFEQISGSVTEPIIEVTPVGMLELETTYVGQSTQNSSAFTVKNVGNQLLTGNATIETGPFEIISGANYSLNPGEEFDISIRFLSDEAGIYTRKITLSGGGGAECYVRCEAREADPVLEVHPHYVVDFGMVACGTSMDIDAFVVANTGGGTLAGNVTVNLPFSIVSGQSYSLTEGQTDNVMIRFAPTFEEIFNGNVVFTGGGGATGQVSGEGIDIAVAPLINSILNDSIMEGSDYFGPIPVLIQGTQPVTWSLVTETVGMTINPETGFVKWSNPTVGGSPHTITIRATNTAGYDDETWLLAVGDVNRPPVLDPIGSKTVNEEVLLEFTITANDPDGDALTYSVSNLPTGASFDVGTQTFSWTPESGDTGNYEVLFTVTDNGSPPMSDFENVTITVGDTNRPPVLDPIGSKTVNEGVLLEFTITANDPDGDALTYSVSNLPTGASFDVGTQTFSWTPESWDTGNYEVLFTVTDNGRPPMSDFETVTITVGDTNRPPVLDPVGSKTVNEEVLLEFTITANDPDGDALAYSVSNLPTGASFDVGTQAFSWTPGSWDTGNYEVLFTVTDNGSPPVSDSENVTITVGDINRPPVLDPIWSKTVNEEVLLEFTITATDPDGGALTYSASNLPTGASFDVGTQTFSWTPGSWDTGNYEVLFTVTDNGSPPVSDFENVTITVGDINRPPVLDPIGSKTINEGVLLEFTITANDPDGDALTYSASNLPTGASFDVGTQTFSWTPGSWDTGNHEVLFTVTDNGIPPVSDSENVTITVGDTNRPPVLDPIGSKTVNEGVLLEFTITANDPDGDALTYSASNLPTGASFDVGTQTFSWTPGSEDADNYEVLFTVTDNGSPQMSDFETVTITVGDTNRPPVLDPIGSKTINEGVLLEFTITANDPDGDALTYSASNLPTGASFDVGTQTFSWTPGSGDTGNHEVLFTVTDNGSPQMSDSEVILIGVETSGVSGSSGGCFIATAAYGSPIHPHVEILRDFRDAYLIPSKLGRALVDIYYKYSPSVADFIMKHKVLKVAVRFSLLPMIVFSYSMLHFGPVFTTFMFLFIFLLPIPLILFCLRRMRRVEAR